MSLDPLASLGLLAALWAVASVVLGRNLTRSVMSGYAFLGLLCLALLAAGAGFLASVIGISATLALASIQAFGWMLVDVDRDHLAPTDPGTWMARGLAFALLGGGLVWLGVWLVPELAERSGHAPPGPRALGEMLFGRQAGAVLLLGLAMAAALLAARLLLRDEEES